VRKGLLQQIILYEYRYIIGYGVLAVTAVLFAFWDLGSIVPGLHADESSYLSSLSWANLIDNPLYLPHKAVSILVLQQYGIQITALRMVSAVISLIGAITFFALIRHRFKARIAVLSVGLLITSSWWLGYARIARPEILIPIMVFVMMVFSRRLFERHRAIDMFLLTLFTGLAVYIPFGLYLISLGLIAAWPQAKSIWQQQSSRLRWLNSVLLFLLLAPLFVSVVRDVSLLRELLVLPDSLPRPNDVLRQVYATISTLFWRAEPLTLVRVGTAPLLDLFSAVMVALGLYHLDDEISKTLARFVLFGLGVLTVITALSGNPLNSVVLLPFVFTLLASGIVMLFSQWYEIFPRNPVARLTAFLPSLVLLVAVIQYHQQRYFVAWARNPAVVEAFPAETNAVLDRLDDYQETGTTTIVLTTEQEATFANMLNQWEPNVRAIQDVSIVEGPNYVLITPEAYQQLTESERALVSSARPIIGQSSQEPIVLWEQLP
jgi:hypothetical protein